MAILSEERTRTLPRRKRAVLPNAQIGSAAKWRASLAEKFSVLGLAILIVYGSARNICHALVRPLWYDEICTAIVVQQEHLTKMWQALVRGADSHPLFFYMMERLAVVLIHNENLAYRAISILGFAATLACLFVVVKTRAGGAFALVCAAVPTVTILSEVFCVEARGYSMVVACIAFACVCYQRVPSRLWVILLGVSLVVAESFHYFAVFAFLPFLFAEITNYGMTRQFRRGVWIALVSGFVPLALFSPLLSSMQAYYGPHMWWPKPTLEDALGSYSWYFLAADAPWGRYLAGLAAIAILLTTLLTIRQTSRGERPEGAPVRELMLALGLLSLPLVGFGVAALAHNGIIAKYFVSGVLGFPLAIGFTLPRLPRGGSLLPIVLGVLLLCVIVPRDRQFWSTYDGQFASPARAVQDFVTAGGHADLPVVISYTHDFLMLQHYSDQTWRRRFVAVLDPEQEVIYTGSDSGAKHLAIVRELTDMPIYDFKSFLAQNPAFLVYSSLGGRDGDWWAGRLKKDGFKLKNVSVRPPELHDYFHRVVLVTQ
jgi:hypothetical protein